MNRVHHGGMSDRRPKGSSLAAATKKRALDRFDRYQNVPVVGLGVDLVRRDGEAAGSMVGSAVAFRLFTFFVPLLLVLVGLAGLATGHIDAGEVNHATGVSGGLGNQIRGALHQSGRTPWLILGLGLVGMVSTGRTLSRVLMAASSNAWRLPITRKSPWRIVGAISGLAAGMGLVAIVVNRARADLGVGVATLSFGPAFAIYTCLLYTSPSPRDS